VIETDRDREKERETDRDTEIDREKDTQTETGRHRESCTSAFDAGDNQQSHNKTTAWSLRGCDVGTEHGIAVAFVFVCVAR